MKKIFLKKVSSILITLIFFSFNLTYGAGWNGEYFFDDNNQLVRNAWVGEYYVGPDGRLVRNSWVGDYYVGVDGRLLRSQWIGNYYVGESGRYEPNASNNPNQIYPYNPYYNNYYSSIYNFYYIVDFINYGDEYINGEPMFERRPIFAGNEPYLVNIANNMIGSAYSSIANYCKDYLSGKGLQGYYLNSASVESSTPTSITLIVNCVLKKKGQVNGNVEFRLTMNLQSNRFSWKNLSIKNNKNSSYDMP